MSEPRRTGRTTRMLQAVAEEAITGKIVAVIYGCGGQKWNLTLLLQQILGHHSVGFDAMKRVKFFHVRDPLVDLEAPRMVRGHDGPVFVDHHAIEVKVGAKLIELLYAWDEKADKP